MGVPILLRLLLNQMKLPGYLYCNSFSTVTGEHKRSVRLLLDVLMKHIKTVVMW